MKVYVLYDISDYGKMISYLINKDINVWRLYWDERLAGDRCIHIDYEYKRALYASKKFYFLEGYDIVVPSFQLDKYGNYILLN